LPNETEFSVSANTGFSFSEDFNLGCRDISLRYLKEDANSRKFSHPDLHGWILEHRQELLNAISGLIQYWHQKGCPAGETPFTSLPEWARIVGGILVTCGLGNPCMPQLVGTMTTDTITAEMKRLFEIAYQENFAVWSTTCCTWQADSIRFAWPLSLAKADLWRLGKTKAVKLEQKATLRALHCPGTREYDELMANLLKMAKFDCIPRLPQLLEQQR
jgi:hypothetical protein